MTALFDGAPGAPLVPALALDPPPRPGRAGGRPSKLTEAVTATICEGLRTGLPAGLAAERAGVSRATYFAWLERGDADDARGLETPYLEFAVRARQARAELAYELCKFLRENRDRPAHSYDSRSILWMLERLFPEDFGRKQAAWRAARPDSWADPWADPPPDAETVADLVARVRGLSDGDLERLAAEERRAG